MSEHLIKTSVDRLKEFSLDSFGYVYVNLADCWQSNRDKNGDILEDPKKFSNGLKSLGAYIHSRGLKFGLYTDVNNVTCHGKPGSYGFEKLDAAKYAEWGVDMVTNDNCPQHSLTAPSGVDHLSQLQLDYSIMSQALNGTGRPMVYVVSKSTEPENVSKISHVRLVGQDITADWDVMLNKVDTSEAQQLAQYAKPGFWNDLGTLAPFDDHGGMSTDEYRTHFSLWCALKAPLMLGSNFFNNSRDWLSIVTNKKAIDIINQDPLGSQAKLFYSKHTEFSLHVIVTNAVCDSEQWQYPVWTYNNQTNQIQVRDKCLTLTGQLQHGQYWYITAKSCDNSTASQRWFLDRLTNQILFDANQSYCLTMSKLNAVPIRLYTGDIPSTYSPVLWSQTQHGLHLRHLQEQCLEVGGFPSIQIYLGHLSHSRYMYVAVLINRDIFPNIVSFKWADIIPDLPKSQLFKMYDVWTSERIGTRLGHYVTLTGHSSQTILLSSV